MHPVAETSLNLAVILLPPPSKSWDYKHETPHEVQSAHIIKSQNTQITLKKNRYITYSIMIINTCTCYYWFRKPSRHFVCIRCHPNSRYITAITCLPLLYFLFVAYSKVSLSNINTFYNLDAVNKRH